MSVTADFYLVARPVGLGVVEGSIGLVDALDDKAVPVTVGQLAGLLAVLLEHTRCQGSTAEEGVTMFEPSELSRIDDFLSNQSAAVALDQLRSTELGQFVIEPEAQADDTDQWNEAAHQMLAELAATLQAHDLTQHFGLMHTG